MTAVSGNLPCATIMSLVMALFAGGAHAGDEASPIFGVKIPADYRGWPMIAPSQSTTLDHLAAILGNATSTAAYRDGTLPFPDGTVLVKLSWERVPLSAFQGAYVPGRTESVQIMVKDSQRYGATGGWGFGKFVAGRPVSEAEHQACFGCHAAHAKKHDFVFTQLAP